MEMFNPDQFLTQTFDQANDTKVVPVPVGEYTAVCTEIKIRPWQSKTDSSKAGLALDLIWSIEDQNVKALLGRDEVKVKQGIMLDMAESGNGLDFGKGRNVGLGRLREAVNLNQPGQPFSIPMVQGRMAKILIKHRVVDSDIYAEVGAVARV